MKTQHDDPDKVLAVVYNLSKVTQQWEELGTGLFKFQDNFDAEGILIGHFILVTKFLLSNTHNEGHDPPPVLIKSLLQADKMYMRQQGTVIYWNEIQLKQQIAVTFSDKKTCDQQWKLLCSFIGKNPYEVGILPPPDSVEMPREDNLQKLGGSVAQKQQAISYYIINKNKFFIDLLQIARQILEKQEDKSKEIQQIYSIFKGIIDYNDSRIIQILFQPSSFPIILQIYNKHLYPNLDLKQMLHQRFQLVKLIDLNQQIIQKIKISHHITFFKDVVLTSNVSISLQATLLLSIQQCNMDIFNQITSETIMQKLCFKINTVQLPQAINFIYEQLIFTKQFNEDIKKKLIEKYYSADIVSELAQIMNNTTFFQKLEQSIQLKIIQIISKISYFNEKAFYQFLKNNANLLQSFVYYFHKGRDEIVSAIMQLLRNFLIMSIDKKNTVDLLIINFFPQQTINIKSNYSLGLPWKKQIENMIQLMISAIQISQTSRIAKMFDILCKNNVFQFLIQLPLTKIQKLKRLKLINIIIFHNTQQMIQIQQSLIESKMFRTAILWLVEANQKNNLLHSSILSILERVMLSEKYLLMEEIDCIQEQLPVHKSITEIITKINIIKQQSNAQLERHHQILENEIEERYFNQDNDYPIIRKISSGDSRQQIEESLKQLAEQLGSKKSFDEQVKLPVERKGIQFTFQFGTINEP